MLALIIIKFILFCLSVLGFGLYIRSKTIIKWEYIPVIVFTCIISILYIASLLNILLYITYIVFILGLYLIIAYIIKNKQNLAINIKQTISKLSIGSLFVLLAITFLGAILRSIKLVDYDNFSHWAIVVKDMLIYNRIPNSSSNVILFKTYPPGSSLFIYYVCKLIGNSESIMVFAQLLLSISCIYSLFGIIKEKRSFFINGVIIISSVFMLNNIYLGTLNNLMVDTLLPLLGISSFIIIFSYQNDIKKAAILSLPIIITTLLVKNSGIFFTLVNSIYLIFVTIRWYKREPIGREYKNVLYVFISILVPFVFSFLWHQHTEYVFPGILSKHSMDIKYFMNVFSSKSMQDIFSIIHNFCSKLFNINTPSTCNLLLINLGIITLYLTMKFQKISGSNKVLIWFISLNMIFIIYQVFVLGTYLVSMPISEAYRLASYDRYSNSIVCFIFGISLITIVDFIQLESIQLKIKHYKIWRFVGNSTLIAFLIFFSLIITKFNFNGLRIKPYTNSIPQRMEMITGDNWHGYKDSRYLIYASDEKQYVSNGYIYYTAEYKLLTKNIVVIDKFSPEQFPEILSNYDYLIIFDEDNRISSFMKGYINERADYIGLYPIKETFHLGK